MKAFSLYGILFFLCLSSQAACGMGLVEALDVMTRKIPPRPASAMTGSDFARYASGMDRAKREQAIVAELLQGNFPEFLRKLKPVHFVYPVREGNPLRATIFTMPDYLAIGSESDSLLIPMNLASAIDIAMTFIFTLPTQKIVDTIFRQSDFHFVPQPLPAGPEMRSMEYYVAHNRQISEQRQTLNISPGALVSGHKKDLVITNRMAHNPDKIAIYGWHRPTGMPIQPLSTVHNARYADDSHGIRLVSDTILIDGEPQSIYQILQDHLLAGLLSDEGPLTVIQQFLGVKPAGQPDLRRSLVLQGR